MYCFHNVCVMKPIVRLSGIRGHTNKPDLTVCVTLVITVSSQVSCGVRRMNFPATPDGAYLCGSAATAKTTAAMAVMSSPVRTAAPAHSPAGRPLPACPSASCVMGGRTARMGGTRVEICVKWPSPGLPPHALCLSSRVATDTAFPKPGGVTTRPTALTAATRTTVVSFIGGVSVIC